MEQLNGKELAEQVAYSINSYNFNDAEFVKQMHREHRTLQQNFMRLIKLYIKETAALDNYDDRNEDSVMMCRKIMRRLDECDMMLPYI